MEEFITLAWDCGLKLGSRVHELKEISEAVKGDITIKSSILESRMIYGSKILWYGYQNILKLLEEKLKKKEFILAKLEEHKQKTFKISTKNGTKHKRWLWWNRESKIMYWIANVLYGVTNTKDLIGVQFSEEEYKKYRQTLEFIFQVRNALHNIAKKKTRPSNL